MKNLFTAEATSKGGRSGTIQSPDGLLDVTLGNPLQKGIEKRGPNPELLFAGAYSACYHGALGNAAKKLGHDEKRNVLFQQSQQHALAPKNSTSDDALARLPSMGFSFLQIVFRS